MVHLRLTLPLAVSAVRLCAAIPIAPQQVILELARGKDPINNLVSDINLSNLEAAKIDYENLQAYLDDFGFSLGQLSDATCVESAPVNSTATAATTRSAVLASINSITSSLATLSSSVSSNDTAAATAAYNAAQNDLESTYDFIFGVGTGSGSPTSSSSSPPSTSSTPAPQDVYSYIQSAQVALNNLAFDIVQSDYSTAKTDFYAISKQINSQIAPAADCSFITTNPASCNSALTCIQSVQFGLNRVAGDLLASASTADDCLIVGADLAATLAYISKQ